MDIGLSSAVFYPNVETEDSIELISSLDFKCAEILLNSPMEFEENFIEELKEKKDKCGLKINSVHSFSPLYEPYLFDTYKRRRNDMLSYYKKVCRAASVLGAECYTFHGMRLDNISQVDFKLNYEIYNTLTYIAGENGIKLAQENVSWCMSSSVEYLNRIKENTKYPLYFTFDIKQAYKSRINPFQYLDIMGDKLVNFHVNDRDDNNVCLLPGRGNVDFQSIFEKIKSQNYLGNVIIEVYENNYNSYTELQKAKKFLADFI